MPSKHAHLIAFVIIFTISVGAHRFVYNHLKRLIFKDFPRKAEFLRRVFSTIFVLGDLPFAFLFFNRYLQGGNATMTKVLLYPFSLWQALMMMWTAILLFRLLFRRTAHAGVSAVRLAKRRSRSAEATPELETV